MISDPLCRNQHFRMNVTLCCDSRINSCRCLLISHCTLSLFKFCDKKSATFAAPLKLPNLLESTFELLLNVRTQSISNFRERDAFHDRVEEANHQQSLGIGASHAARHQIEDRLFLNLTDGCGVFAEHIIHHDLQARHGVRAGISTQHKDSAWPVNLR